MAYICAFTKSMIYTYFYLDKLYFIIVLSSTIGSFIFYILRYYFYVELNNQKYNLLMTYMLHICLMNIIYISSITYKLK